MPSSDKAIKRAYALARQGAGRKIVIRDAGVTEHEARRICLEVKTGNGQYKKRTAAEAPPTRTEVKPPPDPVDTLLTLLGKRREAGVAFDEVTDQAALGELEHRGYVISHRAGRLFLERNPDARQTDAALAGMFDPSRQFHRFAVISDSHFGGYQAQPAFVRDILAEAGVRGCSFVAHVGDVVDGPPQMHAGFQFELGLHRADHQVDYAAHVLGSSPVPVVMIAGNHDGSWFKQAGLDVGRMIAERCNAVRYIGPFQGWIEGPNGDANFIRLFHPGDGSSYALSYKDQKTAEYLVLQNDKVPSGFHFTGHYHKQNEMRGPNGARYLLAPSSCAATSFMRTKRLINHAGAYFIEFTLDSQGRVDRCLVEDVILPPDAWTRCDYSASDWKRARTATTAGLWTP